MRQLSAGDTGRHRVLVLRERLWTRHDSEPLLFGLSDSRTTLVATCVVRRRIASEIRTLDNVEHASVMSPRSGLPNAMRTRRQPEATMLCGADDRCVERQPFRRTRRTSFIGSCVTHQPEAAFRSPLVC
jgi:hypothetical protein